MEDKTRRSTLNIIAVQNDIYYQVTEDPLKGQQIQVIAFGRVADGLTGRSPKVVIDQCPLCGGYHEHGIGSSEPSFGHRSAHCKVGYIDQTRIRKWWKKHPEIKDKFDTAYVIVNANEPANYETAAVPLERFTAK